ncbi:MAG: nucleic acid-binding protein [Turicibacter sp.]
MRSCKQCDSEMVDGFDIKVEGAGYGIKIASGPGIFAPRIEKPSVAICPTCGEVSMYIENLDHILKR